MPRIITAHTSTQGVMCMPTSSRGHTQAPMRPAVTGPGAPSVSVRPTPVPITSQYQRAQPAPRRRASASPGHRRFLLRPGSHTRHRWPGDQRTLPHPPPQTVSSMINSAATARARAGRRAARLEIISATPARPRSAPQSSWSASWRRGSCSHPSPLFDP